MCCAWDWKAAGRFGSIDSPVGPQPTLPQEPVGRDNSGYWRKKASGFNAGTAKLAGSPAVNLTTDDVLDMQRRLIEHGKGRTVNKLRSYLHAAYQCAIDVRMSEALPVALKAYAIHINPVAQTKRDPKPAWAMATTPRTASVAEGRFGSARVRTPGRVRDADQERPASDQGHNRDGRALDAVGDEIEGFQLKRIRSGVQTLLADRAAPRAYAQRAHKR